MHTTLAPFIKDTADGQTAERIVRSCVHCGFCNATCPTYQLMGNELDGPRGRIYLIKGMLEGEPVTQRTLLHLDRCLTCRACETTCPSGVQYGQLAEIGRRVAESRVQRPWRDRLVRRALRLIFPSPRFSSIVFLLGRIFRWLLPTRLRDKIPPSPTKRLTALPPNDHAENHVLLLSGCVQQAATPGTNDAAARLLAYAGFKTTPANGCCGAISHHLSAREEGLSAMRRNIDAWWPAIESGVDAIVSTASGCGLVLRDYGHLLADDPAYATRAAKLSTLLKDISEVLPQKRIQSLPRPTFSGPIAFHPPCTLQHGVGLDGNVELLLNAAGFTTTQFPDRHLCCGSAGTYSVLQPELSERLLAAKIETIERTAPKTIVTSNIGCQLHLARRASVPVRHWVELVAEQIPV